MDDTKSKYLEVEILIGASFALTVDAICFIIDLTGVGLAISPFLQSGSMLILTMWSWSKGDTSSVSMSRQLTKHASNWLPLWPTVLTFFLIEVYLHNNPKVAYAVSKAGAPKSVRSAIKKVQ